MTSRDANLRVRRGRWLVERTHCSGSERRRLATGTARRTGSASPRTAVRQRLRQGPNVRPSARVRRRPMVDSPALCSRRCRRRFGRAGCRRHAPAMTHGSRFSPTMRRPRTVLAGSVKVGPCWQGRPLAVTTVRGFRTPAGRTGRRAPRPAVARGRPAARPSLPDMVQSRDEPDFATARRGDPSTRRRCRPGPGMGCLPADRRTPLVVGGNPCEGALDRIDFDPSQRPRRGAGFPVEVQRDERVHIRVSPLRRRVAELREATRGGRGAAASSRGPCCEGSPPVGMLPDLRATMLRAHCRDDAGQCRSSAW